MLFISDSKYTEEAKRVEAEFESPSNIEFLAREFVNQLKSLGASDITANPNHSGNKFIVEFHNKKGEKCVTVITPFDGGVKHYTNVYTADKILYGETEPFYANDVLKPDLDVWNRVVLLSLKVSVEDYLK